MLKGLQMSDLRTMRWGIVGVVLSLPAGFVLGSWAVEWELWRTIMGTEWVAFKSVVVSIAMVGYALGATACSKMHPPVHDKHENMSDF